MKILANDGMADIAVEKLKENGFEVSTENVPQDNLIDVINEEGYTGVLVRSATKVRQDIVDACPGLKFIGRGGVGMDNIDVEYAREKGLRVQNTPAASSQSVAELVIGHMFSLSRFLYDANRQMPEKGATDFKVLKKKYAKGVELRGKTLGIIGFGRIGQSVASYALGLGMKVVATDMKSFDVQIPVEVGGKAVSVTVNTQSMEEVIAQSDFISIHVPKQKDGSAVIGKNEINNMKDGVFLINTARGGVINEQALSEALSDGKVAGAALDVYENEPTPDAELLKQERLSLSPHIGAATGEAQDRVWDEMADHLINYFKVEISA